MCKRLGELADPVQRAREATQAADVFEAAARIARKVRHRSIAALLATGKGPTEVAELTGVSISTVKVVRTTQAMTEHE